MTVLEQLRALYFNATQSTIGDDFGRAIDLFKQLTTDQEREKAAVFMEGIAEMRREWGADSRNGGKVTRPAARGKGTRDVSAASPAGARSRPGRKPR